METTTILWTTFISLVGLQLCVPDGDTEKMADHKGSFFGGLCEKKKQSQKRLESEVYEHLSKNKTGYVLVESESKRTGIIYEKGVFYKTEKIEKESYETEYLIKEEPDFITFFSSSAVESFFENFEDSALFSKTKFISIGVETRRRLREFGVENIIEAEKSTAEGIIEVIK